MSTKIDPPAADPAVLPPERIVEIEARQRADDDLPAHIAGCDAARRDRRALLASHRALKAEGERLTDALARTEAVEMKYRARSATLEGELETAEALAEERAETIKHMMDANRGMSAERDSAKALAERLRAALEALCDAIADTELHGDGAHDDACPVCHAHEQARSALAAAAEPGAEHWTCHRCSYMNAGSICTKCGALRPKAAAPARSGEEG